MPTPLNIVRISLGDCVVSVEFSREWYVKKATYVNPYPVEFTLQVFVPDKNERYNFKLSPNQVNALIEGTPTLHGYDIVGRIVYSRVQ